MFQFPYSYGCNFTPVLAQLSLEWAKVLQPTWDFWKYGYSTLPPENLTRITEKNVLSNQSVVFCSKNSNACHPL